MGCELQSSCQDTQTEGVRLQLRSSTDQTSAIVVSTMMEAWEVVRAGLVADGTVKDILYGLPLPPNKIDDLSKLRDELAPYGAVVRIMVDHPDQVQYLEQYESQRKTPELWSVFVKVDSGGRYAPVSNLHRGPSDIFSKTRRTCAYISLL
ncbi:hypothetical protein BC835DRAFT_1356104 [Cytidiella melzeri]|nr:hypothetical protein BC835DRAFT_1356104 [Cytidiella melzeri]